MLNVGTRAEAEFRKINFDRISAQNTTPGFGLPDNLHNCH